MLDNDPREELRFGIFSLARMFQPKRNIHVPEIMTQTERLTTLIDNMIDAKLREQP